MENMTIHNIATAQLGKDVCNFRIQYKIKKIRHPLEKGPRYQRWLRLREIPLIGNGVPDETEWFEISARELATLPAFKRWLKDLGGRFEWTGGTKDLVNLHGLLCANPVES